MELPGHRRDRLADAAAVDREERMHEVVDGQRRLANELAEQRLLAQPPGAEQRMCHHALLLDRGPAFRRVREK